MKFNGDIIIKPHSVIDIWIYNIDRINERYDEAYFQLYQHYVEHEISLGTLCLK